MVQTRSLVKYSTLGSSAILGASALAYGLAPYETYGAIFKNSEIVQSFEAELLLTAMRYYAFTR
jgi:hypothetical protein